MLLWHVLLSRHVYMAALESYSFAHSKSQSNHHDLPRTCV